MDVTCLQFHDNQQIERCQAALGPDFHRRKVYRCQNVPMRLQEGAPGAGPLPFGSRLNHELLLAVDPAGQAHNVQLPGLKREVHGSTKVMT